MNNIFAETLKHLRHVNHMSQQQLAERLYVSRATIANWESGRRAPDTMLISRLAAELHVEVSALLSGTDTEDDTQNVIVVDDERIVLSGSLSILEKVFPKASITGFTRPSDALFFAEKNPLYLAFLDIEIGKTSGLTLCKRLQDINPHTNVIFLTAYAEYSLDAWNTGACGFLVKPIQEEDVKLQVSRLIPSPLD